MTKDRDSELARWLENKSDQSSSDGTSSSYDLETINKVVDMVDQLEIPHLDVKASWKQVQPALHTQGKSNHRRMWITAIAASLIILIGAVFWFGPIKNELVGNNELIKLPDGYSYAFFKDNATIRYRNKQKRAMELEGTAHFHVAPGTPFSVMTTLGTVRVLGTSFEIAQGNEMAVSCFSGRVAVDIGQENLIYLDPGQGIIIEPNGQITEQKFKITQPTWVENIYQKGDISFEKRIDLMELVYEINIEKPTDYNPQFFGALPLDNLQLAIEILEQALDVKINQSSPDTYVIEI